MSIRISRSSRVILFIFLVALGVGLSYRLWLPGIAAWLEVSDPLVKVEAVVPLGGGKERVLYAARLYREGYARWFLATNMPLDLPGVRERYSDLVAKEAIWQGVPASAIVISDQTVKTTYAEAVEILRITRARGWHSILVVTSPYHTRRARWILREVFQGSGLEVRLRAAPEEGYNPQNWWQSSDGLRNTWTEYLKLVLRFLGYE